MGYRVSRRTNCSACGSSDLETFLDLGTSPVADAYVSDVDASLRSPRYPLQVAVCPKCRLVQLLEVLDPKLLFGSGYHFYSSASPPLSSYHARYAQGIISFYTRLRGTTASPGAWELRIRPDERLTLRLPRDAKTLTVIR